MRRPRRSEQETAAQVMRVAVEHISDHGLRVGLELPMEDIISAADVARAAAYRIWPSRDAFTAAVLDRLAEGQVFPALDYEDMTSVVRTIETRMPRTALSVDIACELLALAVEREFEILISSDAWRAFVLFEAVVASLADTQRRERKLRQLAAVDEEHDQRIGELYEVVVQALGLQPTSRQALLDVARCARLLDRGLAQDVMREPASPTVRHISRRRLATATAALLRAALVVDDRNPPEDWAEAVLSAIQGHEALG